MSVVVHIKGIREIGEVARKLRQAGRKDLQKELYAGLNRATKRPRAQIRVRALTTLPRSGGLAGIVARSRLSARQRRNGIRIVDSGKINLSQIDAGRVGHPVFGRRNAWVTQSVKPGFFTQPLVRSAPAVRREIERGLGEIARKVEG